MTQSKQITTIIENLRKEIKPIRERIYKLDKEFEQIIKEGMKDIRY